MSPCEVEGEVFDTAFTFAVDAVGKPFDRATGEGELPLQAILPRGGSQV
jgi:hypothetical protein